MRGVLREVGMVWNGRDGKGGDGREGKGLKIGWSSRSRRKKEGR